MHVAAQAALPPALPPVENCAKLPLLTDMALSPDGKQFAALMNIEGTMTLVTRDVAGTELRAILNSDNRRYHYNWVSWVGNQRLLASVRLAAQRYSVGTVETRLVSIRSNGTDQKELVKHSPFDRDPVAQIQDRVVDWLPDDGEHVPLQLRDTDGWEPAVYKVSAETGKRTLVHGSQRGVWQWITDANHRVCVGERLRDSERSVIACDPDGRNWRTLSTFKNFAREAVTPLGFGRNPQELFVSADHEGRAAVFAVDLGSPELRRVLRLAHPTLDVEGALLRSPASGEVLACAAAR